MSIGLISNPLSHHIKPPPYKQLGQSNVDKRTNF